MENLRNARGIGLCADLGVGVWTFVGSYQISAAVALGTCRAYRGIFRRYFLFHCGRGDNGGIRFRNLFRFGTLVRDRRRVSRIRRVAADFRCPDTQIRTNAKLCNAFGCTSILEFYSNSGQKFNSDDMVKNIRTNALQGRFEFRGASRQKVASTRIQKAFGALLHIVYKNGGENLCTLYE